MNVSIKSWKHLQEKVEDWAGDGVRRLDIDFQDCSTDQQRVAKALFGVLEKVPNLRQLRLNNLSFTSFNAADSKNMQTSLFLPHLSDLTITHFRSPHPFPQSFSFDLLKTSGHRISRLQVCGYRGNTIAPSEEHQLDFGGNLRRLVIWQSSYSLLFEPLQVDFDSLKGLEELEINCDGEVGDRSTDKFRVIAPTLKNLSLSVSTVGRPRSSPPQSSVKAIALQRHPRSSSSNL